jgi:hypothetical protein
MDVQLPRHLLMAIASEIARPVGGMRNNANMPRMQILEERPRAGNPTLLLLPSSRGSFRELESDSREALLLGNESLLAIAFALKGKGFRISDVTLADQSLMPIDDGYVDDEIATLLDALNSDDWRRVEQIMESSLFGCVISSIAVRRRRPDFLTLRFFQNGGLEIDDSFTDEAFDQLSEVIARVT